MSLPNPGGMSSSSILPLFEQAAAEVSVAPLYAPIGCLATVGLNGKPASRHMGWHWTIAGEKKASIFCFTHAKTQKIEELKQNEAVQVCFYFPLAPAQCRMSGNAQVVSAGSTEAALQEHRSSGWKKLPDAMKEHYAGPTEANAPSDEFLMLWIPLHSVEWLNMQTQETVREDF